MNKVTPVPRIPRVPNQKKNPTPKDSKKTWTPQPKSSKFKDMLANQEGDQK